MPGTYDIKNLHKKLKSDKFKKIAVVGGGFMANELVASIRQNYPDLEVHMIFNDATPACKLGPEVGQYLYMKHTSNGVTIHDNQKVVGLTMNDKREVKGLKL